MEILLEYLMHFFFSPPLNGLSILYDDQREQIFSFYGINPFVPQLFILGKSVKTHFFVLFSVLVTPDRE